MASEDTQPISVPVSNTEINSDGHLVIKDPSVVDAFKKKGVFNAEAAGGGAAITVGGTIPIGKR